MSVEAFAIARLFSSAVLKEMARLGRSPLFARLVDEGGIPFTPRASVGDFFDQAFDLLKSRELRNEYVYKAALAEKVLLGVHSLRTASMLTEFRVGPCKADVVILNGTGTVYEIKSERDSLVRLARQIEAYRIVFPVVNVIVGENHVAEVLDSVDASIGVMSLSRRFRITTEREAVPDNSRISSLSVLETLTMREAELLLTSLGVSFPVVPNTRRYAMLAAQFANLAPTDAHVAMVSVLKKTRSHLPISQLLDSVPTSLRSLVLSVKLRKQDYGRLIGALSTPMTVATRWGQHGLSSLLPREAV